MQAWSKSVSTLDNLSSWHNICSCNTDVLFKKNQRFWGDFEARRYWKAGVPLQIVPAVSSISLSQPRPGMSASLEPPCKGCSILQAALALLAEQSPLLDTLPVHPALNHTYLANWAKVQKTFSLQLWIPAAHHTMPSQHLPLFWDQLSKLGYPVKPFLGLPAKPCHLAMPSSIWMIYDIIGI